MPAHLGRTGRSPSRLRGLLIVAALAVGLCRAADIEIPDPPPVSAGSYLLVDHLTGSVLTERAADQVRAPASLTKLMTAYLAFEALRDGAVTLDEHVVVSEKAWRMRGSRMFIEVGNQVSIEDLLRGLIVQSGNDAAVALAERLAGSVDDFVDIMNARAASLGMSSTVFKNPTGLPAAGHVSTARDLARLTGALLDDFPEFAGLFAEREFTYNGIRQYNRNRLLGRYENVDGMKTGYTASAGYCLVVTAVRSGMRLIAVVLGSETSGGRVAAGQRLLDYGFESFETHKLFGKGEPIRAAKVWKGVADSAPVGLARDLYVTIPRGAYDALSAVMNFRAELVAPVDAEIEIGDVSVSLAGQTLSTAPIVVLEAVSPGGTWTRLKHELLLRFREND